MTTTREALDLSVMLTTNLKDTLFKIRAELDALYLDRAVLQNENERLAAELQRLKSDEKETSGGAGGGGSGGARLLGEMKR